MILTSFVFYKNKINLVAFYLFFILSWSLIFPVCNSFADSTNFSVTIEEDADSICFADAYWNFLMAKKLNALAQVADFCDYSDGVVLLRNLTAFQRLKEDLRAMLPIKVVEY